MHDIPYHRSDTLSETDIIQLCHMIHYPGHWDTINYPTLMDALIETITDFHCSTCEEMKKFPNEFDT